MAARTFRCADHAKCITLARANAERAWGARVRRDARYSRRASRTGGLSNALDHPPIAGMDGSGFLVNVCFWHLADIPEHSTDVRFWG